MDVEECEQVDALLEGHRFEPVSHRAGEVFEGPAIALNLAHVGERDFELFALSLEAGDLFPQRRGGGFEGRLAQRVLLGVVADESPVGLAGTRQASVDGLDLLSEFGFADGEASPSQIFLSERDEPLGFEQDLGDRRPDGGFGDRGGDLWAAAVLEPESFAVASVVAEIAGFSVLPVAVVGGAAGRLEAAREEVAGGFAAGCCLAAELGLDGFPFGVVKMAGTSMTIHSSGGRRRTPFLVCLRACSAVRRVRGSTYSRTL